MKKIGFLAVVLTLFAMMFASCAMDAKNEGNCKAAGTYYLIVNGVKVSDTTFEVEPSGKFVFTHPGAPTSVTYILYDDLRVDSEMAGQKIPYGTWSMSGDVLTIVDNLANSELTFKKA